MSPQCPGSRISAGINLYQECVALSHLIVVPPLTLLGTLSIGSYVSTNELEKLEAARSAYFWLPLVTLLGITGPYSALLCLTLPYSALLGLTRPYLALLGHTQPYWALLGLTRPYWALLGLTGPYWALLGLT